MGYQFFRLNLGVPVWGYQKNRLNLGGGGTRVPPPVGEEMTTLALIPRVWGDLTLSEAGTNV